MGKEEILFLFYFFAVYLLHIACLPRESPVRQALNLKSLAAYRHKACLYFFSNLLPSKTD